jgi:hypothetical protein
MQFAGFVIPEAVWPINNSIACMPDDVNRAVIFPLKRRKSNDIIRLLIHPELPKAPAQR